MKLLIALTATLLPFVGEGLVDNQNILDAIRMVECGDVDNPPDGDGGRAIGPYQIHEAYFIDSRIKGDYQQCRDRAFAERVVEAYMKRWCSESWASGEAEVIARIHNGGPRAMSSKRKRYTDGYWAKVKKELER